MLEDRLRSMHSFFPADDMKGNTASITWFLPFFPLIQIKLFGFRELKKNGTLKRKTV